MEGIREVRIHDLYDFKRRFLVERCIHIAVNRKRGKYYHHLLVLKVTDECVIVIHYTSIYPILTGSKSVGNPGKIQIEWLYYEDNDFAATFPFESGVYCIMSDRYPRTEEEKNEATYRAFSRLDETNYHLSWNSCEHYVTWALTCKPFCRQLENVSVMAKFQIDFIDKFCSQYLNIWWLIRQFRYRYKALGSLPLEIKHTAETLTRRSLINFLGSVTVHIIAQVIVYSFCTKNLHFLNVLSSLYRIMTLWNELEGLCKALDDGIIRKDDFQRERFKALISVPTGCFLGVLFRFGEREFLDLCNKDNDNTKSASMLEHRTQDMQRTKNRLFHLIFSGQTPSLIAKILLDFMLIYFIFEPFNYAVSGCACYGIYKTICGKVKLTFSWIKEKFKKITVMQY